MVLRPSISRGAHDCFFVGPGGENRGKSSEPSVTPTGLAGLAAVDLTDDALEPIGGF